MNDYLNLLKEYNEINSNYEAIITDFHFFDNCTKEFISSITSIDKCLSNNENIKENSLVFFAEKYKILSEKIKHLFTKENIDIISPISAICENHNNQVKKLLTSFNNIKNELFEGKLKLNNAKNDYIEILKEENKAKESKKNSEKDDLDKTEHNLLFDTKKNSSFTLYKYQLDKLNEKIDESNKKYSEIKPELDSMNLVRESTYKIIILKFAKIVGNVGNIFINFKNDIEGKFLKQSNEKAKKIPYKNNDIIERFTKEKLITEEDIELISKENNNENNNIIKEEQNKEENSNNNNIIINNDKINLKPTKSLEGFGFEIINEPISSEDPTLISLINESIKKLLNEKEISSSDISLLLESIKFDSDCSLKFLSEFQKCSEDNIINLKNENNFIHIANLFNELILSKSNNIEISNAIIELSKTIKYNDEYISSILRKKNKIIGSKNFWMNLIDKKLIFQLNKFINELINNKSKEAKAKKISSPKLSEKFINILNNIPLYKKLNKKQKIQVEEYIKKELLCIISNYITNMTNFFIKHNLIIDIISYYVENFELGIETYYYFESLINIKFQKHYIKLNPTKEHLNEKYGNSLNKEQIILINAFKFLPKENYILLFLLNKSFYSVIRKYIIKYRLKFLDLSLNERIKMWECLLNVNEIKKKYDYKSIKENFLNNSSQPKLHWPKKAKYLNLIDLDLERTPLFCNQETHKIKANFILKCSITQEDEINYYQGMNYLLLFIYQALNCDEEKTFYVFFSLLKNTNYIDVFKNEMKDLVIYFKIFNKIIELNFQDIYYSLKKKQVLIQLFATQWFVTLFNSDSEEFEKNKIPKFLILVFESYLCYGFCGVLNVGLALILLNKDKIFNLGSSSLMKYMIKGLNLYQNIGEKDYEFIKQTYINNLEKINVGYFQKLISTVKFEEENSFLHDKGI